MIICDMCGDTIEADDYSPSIGMNVNDDLCAVCKEEVSQIYSSVHEEYKAIMRNEAERRIEALRNSHARKNGLKMMIKEPANG